MTINKHLLWLVLFALQLSLAAQDTKVIDSLEVALTKAGSEEKVRIMIELSKELVYSDNAKAFRYGEEAYTIAVAGDNRDNELAAALTLSMLCYVNSDLDKAMEYAIKVKELAEDLKLEKYQARAMDAIGSIYYDIGNQAKSSENFFGSLKIYEKLKDKDGIGGTFCRIGTLYLDQKDYDKAVEYYSKSISIAKEINRMDGIASNLNNLAKVYSEKKEYEKALQSYNEALQINIEMENSYLIASNYLNIADVYVALKQYPVAIQKLQQAQEIFDKLGNKIRLAKCRVMLSEIYLQMGEHANGEEEALSALRIGESQKYNQIIVSAAGVLNKLYLAKKDTAAAFRYFALEKQYQDSLFLTEKQKTLSKLELQYQFEKNEQQARSERQRRNVIIIIISGCLIFCLIIIFLILKQLKLKAKKLELEKINHEQELDFKNKEMVLNVMSLMKKNEMLADLSEKLIHIEEESTTAESKDTIKKVAHELQKSQEGEIWKEFSYRFKEVHGEFYDKILLKYPTLTPNELKLCAFLRLNMSSKDIAELTGQRVSTLETARYRLRQKMGIANTDVNLITFLSSM
jgi:tetratricopeptide (TPR) repeat protein/DNA-binding CsgD family transcriptional regulator